MIYKAPTSVKKSGRRKVLQSCFVQCNYYGK